MSTGNKSRPSTFPIVGILLLAGILGAGLLLRIAEQQDRREESRSREFVTKLLSDNRLNLKRALSDYASWGQAYEHLHVNFDFDWAFTKQNVGPTLYDDLDIDYLLLFDPSGREIYSIYRGHLVEGGLSRGIGGDLDQITGKARSPGNEKDTTFEGVGFVDGDPVLLVASPVTPGGDASVEHVDGPPSVLVMGDRLDAGSLEKLGNAAFVPHLRTERKIGNIRREPRRILSSADGKNSAVLRWDPERPGTEMLRTIAPWAGLATCGLVALVFALVRRAHRAVDAVERKSDELIVAHRQAEHRSRHDEVTGLLNRNGISQIAEEHFFGIRDHSFALIFMDLDRFKLVNDALGHEAGDFVLREIGRRIQSVLEKADTVARVGGDEFAALVEEAEPTRLEALCDRLSQVVSRPLKWGTTELGVGISFGIAIAPSSASTYAELARHADVALYQSKAEGRGICRFFSPKMNEHVIARQKLDRELRQAIRAGILDVHYQPQFEAAGLRLCGVEALVRWPHPERGIIPPNDFITLAEETGQIIDLGNLVLEKACRAALTWPSVVVSVNVSPLQFRDARFVETVDRIIRDVGISPDLVELELTESVLLDHRAAAAATFRALKSLGVRLALDDFGSGYSSLNYLRTFPFDRLKIDRAFISDLKPTGEARAIVRAIIDLGRSLGMEVIAEGVETVEQLLVLQTDHCSAIQGFLTGRPAPEPEFRTRFLSAPAQQSVA